MIGDIIKLAEIGFSLIPKELKNVKVDFNIKELDLWFVCDDKNLGDFRVSIYDRYGTKVAYLEGKNHRGSAVNIGHNCNNYNREFLDRCFHMSRCRREFERLDDINYSKGFDYFRKKAIASFQKK